MTRGALHLADQLRVRAAAHGRMDHLKLQKLVFYAYGAALAYGVASEIGELTFEPWKHGPVNREVWNAFKEFRSDAIEPPARLDSGYADPRLVEVLDDVVEVYGRMSSWGIRCESHRELPWLAAMSEGRRPITTVELRKHFTSKFAPDAVQLPVYLAGAANAAVDGIPRARFASLHAMAETLRAVSRA